MFTKLDREMMSEALALAHEGLYTTHPNPRVGCVLAQEGVVVGRGFHARAGGAHAEIEALRAAGEAARGATAYVTLEPCCHHGRTPPCTDALIAANVARVVYAHADPNPLVAGGGHARLSAAGIVVESGLLRDEARALNPGYLSRCERGRVFLRSKLAISLDGRTALGNGESKWITGKAAREEVQQWRGRSSAILSGIGTVLADNPGLNARLDLPEVKLMQPARVILDTNLRLPADARLFREGGPVHVITASEKSAHLDQATVHKVNAGPDGVDLEAVMSVLMQLGFNEVLVEAGASLNGSLLAAGLIDELVIYMATSLMGEGGRPLAKVGSFEHMSQRIPLSLREVSTVGEDLRMVLQPVEKGGN